MQPIADVNSDLFKKKEALQDGCAVGGAQKLWDVAGVVYELERGREPQGCHTRRFQCSRNQSRCQTTTF